MHAFIYVRRTILFLLCLYGFHAHAISLQTYGRYLKNGSGDTIILRGVNYALIDDGSISLANPTQYQNKINQVAMTGANCIRLPWYTSGTHWRDLPSSGGTAGTVQGYVTNGHLSNIISYCHSKGLIVILELHDGTCSNNWTYFNSTLAPWWKSSVIQNMITAHKDYLIINLANEFGYVQWTGNAASARTTFNSNYNSLITYLRGVGVTVPIMIDAPDCGQSSSDLMLMSASLYNNDPLHNLIFSAHAYWSGYASNQAQVQAKLNQAVDSNRCFILGEIANSQDNASCGQISLASLYPIILQEACARKIGWLAWTFDQDCDPNREMTTNGQFANLTTYGNDIVYNANYGLLSTSGCGNIPIGNSFTYPILTTLPYSKTVNTQIGSGFTSTYTGAQAQASPDVFFKIQTGPCADSLKLSSCGSAINTVIHLLDASGTQIGFNDDNGSYCSGTAASLKFDIAPNTTYYAVLEGSGTAAGSMNILIEAINTYPNVSASAINACAGSTVNLVGSPAGGSFSVANPYTGPSTNYTYTYTNAQGCSKTSLPASIVMTNCINLQVKLWLQGYMMGSNQLQAVKMNQGVGNSTTLCDNITLRLHSAANPSLVMAGPTTVNLATNGIANAVFEAPNANYYISVIHRNSIETWSATAIACNNNTVYDFSTQATKAYGNNQAFFAPNVFALYTGDLNQDGFIDAFDFPLFDQESFLNTNGIYTATDMNGDGFVDSFDFPILDENMALGISSVHP
ncbi:MAG TPA: cellulase family glycosylhydrolase [Chitinophagaceae bacterium]|nr:cellulase family glycosylhydrolase [Chitinophagaceae bacterium]